MRLRQMQTPWLLAATVVGLISLIQFGCSMEESSRELSDGSPTSSPASAENRSPDDVWQDFVSEPMDSKASQSASGVGGYGGGGGGLGGDPAEEDASLLRTPDSESASRVSGRSNGSQPGASIQSGRFADGAVPTAETREAKELAETLMEPDSALTSAPIAVPTEAEVSKQEPESRGTDGSSLFGGMAGDANEAAGEGYSGGDYGASAMGRGGEARLSRRERIVQQGSDRQGGRQQGALTPAPQQSGEGEALAADDKESDEQPAYYAGHRFMLMDGFDRFAAKKKGREAEQSPLTFDLQPGEELWIIAKAVDATQPAPPDQEIPGCGALMAQLPNKTERVPVPLKHTSVEGTIDGYIASVDVTQQFHNPYSSKIEAVYVFPLPQNAAVNEFVMTVGDRKIRGIIREREKAEQIYAEARRQGHVASLLTQERPNIFTQKVANIEPGKRIDINIRYFNTLRYDDGAYEFVFPMVVGPRFNPPTSADGVGAVARGTHGSSGQATEVQYLAPHERSGHDISLSLNINAGVNIEDIHSVNHAVKSQPVSECQRRIELAGNKTIPNKDFVLRYKIAGDQIKTAMLTHEDHHGKYFTVMLYPPADLTAVQRSPMEMVFVLDCSGSMSGKPIEQAKAAIAHALHSLTPRDTFQIIRFSNDSSQLGSEPVIATPQNIQRGLQYLNGLHGSGGTHMIEGIKAALDFHHDEGRFRLVSFMTDGFIGNEQQILGTLDKKLGASRVFSFGVGQSPNRFLMDRMANLGRGAVAYLSLNDDAAEIMDHFNQRISHPAMTDLAIDWGDMQVADVYPRRVPDLIVGRPVILTGRFKGTPSTVKVNGLVNMEPASFSVSLDEANATDEHNGIAAVWARMKIKDLLMRATLDPSDAPEVKELVTHTALNYNLMSSFTAFVAVDSMTKTSGNFGTTVAVPVPVPQGVKYETTVR